MYFKKGLKFDAIVESRVFLERRG